jgi:lipoyl(octanoyl) transferase
MKSFGYTKETHSGVPPPSSLPPYLFFHTVSYVYELLQTTLGKPIKSITIKLDMDGSEKKSVIYEYINKIRYEDALSIQESAYEKIKLSEHKTAGYLFLLEHYPVITNGRFGSDENFVLPVNQIEKLGIEVYKSDRGGDLTYHGPGQLVAYPIINLRAFNLGVKAYITSLEQVLINLLSDLGIHSCRREGYPGVWTNAEKIASIGVSVKNGITMHGVALNVSTDLDSFSLIVPCGISDVRVTSMEKTLGSEVHMKDVVESFIKHFGIVFNTCVNKENGPG